ncbi:hypothetical protein ACPV5R_13335 [Vibrio astriarenae]
MKTNSIKNSIVAVAVTSIIAGCGGSSENPDNGGGSGYTQMKSNTKGATAFAFVTEGVSFTEKDSIDTILPRNGEPSLTTASGSCDDLVKVVEVEIEDPDSPDPENPEFITEKVFSRSDSNNCHINEVIAMKEHLVLNGYFYQLADANGKEIELCKVVALPMDEASGLGECLVWHENTETHVAPQVTGLSVTADGEGLQIMYQHEREMYGDRYDMMLGYWDNNATVETIHQYTTDSQGAREADVVTSWSYDGSEFYFAQKRTYLTRPAHLSYGGGGIGFDDNLYVPRHHTHQPHLAYVSSGEYVITNHRSEDSSVFGNLVINTKIQQPFGLTSVYLNGNEGTLMISHGQSAHVNETEEYLFFTGAFDTNGGAGWVGESLLRARKDDLGTGSLYLEQVFDFTDYTTIYSHVGNSNLVFLFNGGELTYFDLNEVVHVGDNIYDRDEFDGYDNIVVRNWVNGLKFIASDTVGGRNTELYFDQISGEITEDPIDRQEIGGTIPLFPTSDLD